jgi:glycogen phosphorylase
MELNKEPKIAYFSMEIGLSADLPTYSGGLGVLAGDTIKSAADLKLPMVAVTLIHRKGYFNQSIDANGWQVEGDVDWSPADAMTLQTPTVEVQIEGRRVVVQSWRYDVVSPTGGILPVIFLDTSSEENDPVDRTLTDKLYGGDHVHRLKQEVVLGIGGARMLDALEVEVKKYHLNEGHASLLTIELLLQSKRDIEQVWDERLQWDDESVRERCVFTTHTPVAAGHDKFGYDVVEQVLGDTVDMALLKELAGEDSLNMTMLALNLSRYVNGVAKKHGEVSQHMFEGYAIHAITNGIHSYTWTAEPFKQLFDRYIPGWANEPELFVRVDNVPDQEIWDTHQTCKQHLVDYAAETAGVQLDPEVLTIGFARRAATYKRADLIFSDLDRLREIGKGKLQIVYAGKAHPADTMGKELIQRVVHSLRELDGDIQGAYLPGYDMNLSSVLIPGVDVWLNNPVRPQEASGTSGMKAAHNGVPNFSVLDGWWIEGHIEGVTGWAIGPEAKEVNLDEWDDEEDLEGLYHKLEQVLLPTYYEDRARWISIMKGAIGKNAYYFNTHRMMRRYVTEAYLP